MLMVDKRLHCLVNELVERAEEDRVEYNRVARGLTLSVGLKEAGGTRHVSGVSDMSSQQQGINSVYCILF